MILPQAFRGAIAPLGSVLIALTKNTTVASVIGVAEASGLMKEIMETETASLGVFFIFALGFVILTLPTDALHLDVPATGGEAMSAQNVLFDAPGPRPACATSSSTIVGAASSRRSSQPCCGSSAEQGQLEGALWSPLATAEIWSVYFLPGIVATLKAAAVSIVGAMVFGVVFGMGRLSQVKPIRWLSGIIVEFFRAVPVLLMMYFRSTSTSHCKKLFGTENNAFAAVGHRASPSTTGRSSPSSSVQASSACPTASVRPASRSVSRGRNRCGRSSSPRRSPRCSRPW